MAVSEMALIQRTAAPSPSCADEGGRLNRSEKPRRSKNQAKHKTKTTSTGRFQASTGADAADLLLAGSGGVALVASTPSLAVGIEGVCGRRKSRTFSSAFTA